MLAIPLSLFVIIYALFTLATLIFAFINIYHIVNAGALNLLSFSISALSVLLLFGIIVMTGIFVNSLNLGQAAVLFENTSLIPAL